jgi:hypothetical protein
LNRTVQTVPQTRIITKSPPNMGAIMLLLVVLVGAVMSVNMDLEDRC